MNSFQRKVNQTFRPLRRRGRNTLVAALAVGVVAGFVPGAMPAMAAPAKAAPVTGGDSLWSASASRVQGQSDGNTRRVNPSDYAAFTLEGDGMRSRLAKAPDEEANAAGLTVAVPAPTGELIHFRVTDSPIMESKLAAKNPDITTYAGRGIEDPTTTIRLDYTKTGFHASVRGPAGQNSWYVDPAYNNDTSLYLSYFGEDLPEPKKFEEQDPIGAVDDAVDAAKIPTDGQEMQRTYRLALLTDPSYAAYFGTENVLSEKVTLMNRVNQVYNDDLGVKMVLINDSDKLNLDTMEEATGANGPCGAAPCFTPAQVANNGCQTTRQRIVIGQLVGAESYDIGHLGLGVNGGGVASLGVVGGSNKANGCTGLPQPEGDFYAVDYVAHEMGHQFSGNHTFGGNQVNCGGNGSANTSVEPGSGSSVMAYAGICGQDNLQPHSDPYFSQRSISEMTTFILNPRPNAAGCATVSPAQCLINDVQNVSLYNFDGTDSFTLNVTDPADGQVHTTAPIVRGTSYNAAGIKAAIEAVLPPVNGVPATVTVTAFGSNSSTVTDTGFQVTFGSTGANFVLNRLSGLDIAKMGFNPVDGDVTGFAGTTSQGGPIQNSGYLITPNGNSAPQVGAPAAKSIPMRTPFSLTGSGSDADGDALTYSWEQNDRRGASGTSLVNNVKVDGPLFRQFEAYAPVTPAGTLLIDSPGENHAGTSPTRTFPDMAQILANNTNATDGTCPAAPPPPASGGASNVPVPIVECFAEFLPTADYVGSTQAGNTEPSLNFRLTARDGNADGGATGFADVKLTIDKTAGPFIVSSKNTAAAAVAGRGEVLTWAVANTTALAPNVKISLSTDGGETFSEVLAESTPNDGTERIVWPNIATDHARIKIEAVDNYFFDVNNADFEIVGKTLVTNDAEGDVAVQYSDSLDETVTVSAEDGTVNGAALTASASGLPSGLTLEEGDASENGVRPGTKTWTVEGTADAAPGSYPVTVTVSGGDTEETTTFTIVVTAEDATVEQAPPASVVTNESDEGTVTVPLTAHVHEVDDGEVGDITNATVTFLDADDEVLCEDVAVSATEVKGTSAAKHELAGEAVCEADVPVTEGETTTYDFSMVIGGYYTGEPADGTFEVTYDATAPGTTITSGPEDGSFVLSNSVTFEFVSDDATAGFQCLFDGSQSDCDSGSFTTSVSPGSHAFEVQAGDDAGNVDESPAAVTFTRPHGIGVFTKDSDWKKGESNGAYGGKFLKTKANGAVLSYDVSNAHRVALVGQTGPGMGKVRVFLKGTPLGTVVFNDPGGDTQGKQLFVLEVPQTMSGPLVIVTSNRKTVRIEGVGVQTQP